MQHLRKNGRLQKVLGWSWIPPLLSHKQKAVIAIWQFSVALCYSDFWWIKSHFNVDMSDTLLETICINGTRPPYKRPAWVIGQVGSEELQNRRAQTATSRERQNHSSYDKRRPKWVTRIYNFCCKLIAATVSAHSLLNSIVYSIGDCVYGVYYNMQRLFSNQSLLIWHAVIIQFETRLVENC